MDGSIRFNDDINIEIAVDLTAEEGARLTGAKNLVDGQELGAGSDLPVVTEADAGKVLAVNASGEWAAEDKSGKITFDDGVLSLTPNQLIAIISSKILPWFMLDFGTAIQIYRFGYYSHDGGYSAVFFSCDDSGVYTPFTLYADNADSNFYAD